MVYNPHMVTHFRQPSSYLQLAWVVLVFTLIVVIWGGFTSASGSGDGCGTSWPLCGQLAAEGGPSGATLVEFTHRVTSGLSLLGVVALLILGRRRFPAGHPVRLGSALAMVFMITESLLGAGLVIFEWVDTNVSLARAVVQPIHLFNTYLLMGSIALTVWWAAGNPALSLRGQGRLVALVAAGLVGVILISAFGTFASLASHIFPSESFLQGVQNDFARDSHYLIRLRIWHPILATLIGFWLFYLGRLLNRLRPHPRSESLNLAVLVVFGLQYALGGLTAVLLAPIPLQLTHLLLAHLLWLLVLWQGADALAAPA